MSSKDTVKPVILQRHQAGSQITTRDLNTIQDNVQRALNELGSRKIQASQLAPGAVQQQAIASDAISSPHIQDGTVGGDLLNPFLLSACKYIVDADQPLASDVAIAFGTKIYDGEGLIVASKFRPVKSGVYRCNALIRIEDDGSGFVQHGQNARVVLYDETEGAPVLLGAECPCITDIKGDVINAVLDETFEAIADHEYTVRHQIPYQYTTGTVTVIHHIGYHAGEVKASQTFVNGDGSINIDASFVEFQPIAQPE